MTGMVLGAILRAGLHVSERLRPFGGRTKRESATYRIVPDVRSRPTDQKVFSTSSRSEQFHARTAGPTPSQAVAHAVVVSILVSVALVLPCSPRSPGRLLRSLQTAKTPVNSGAGNLGTFATRRTPGTALGLSECVGRPAYA
jgi:hypothetical protein